MNFYVLFVQKSNKKYLSHSNAGGAKDNGHERKATEDNEQEWYKEVKGSMVEEK